MRSASFVTLRFSALSTSPAIYVSQRKIYSFAYRFAACPRSCAPQTCFYALFSVTATAREASRRYVMQERPVLSRFFIKLRLSVALHTSECVACFWPPMLILTVPSNCSYKKRRGCAKDEENGRQKEEARAFYTRRMHVWAAKKAHSRPKRAYGACRPIGCCPNARTPSQAMRATNMRHMENHGTIVRKPAKVVNETQ